MQTKEGIVWAETTI